MVYGMSNNPAIVYKCVCGLRNKKMCAYIHSGGQ